MVLRLDIFMLLVHLEIYLNLYFVPSNKKLDIRYFSMLSEKQTSRSFFTVDDSRL